MLKSEWGMNAFFVDRAHWEGVCKCGGMVDDVHFHLQLITEGFREFIRGGVSSVIGFVKAVALNLRASWAGRCGYFRHSSQFYMQTCFHSD